MENKRKQKRRKSEIILNSKSSEADVVELKVKSKIKFFSSVKVKLLQNDDDDSPDSAKKVKFVRLKSIV